MSQKKQESTTHGVFTALVTPFHHDGSIDWEFFKKILRDQKDAKVHGVIPCGTTGESPTLTEDEKKQLIQTTIEELKGSGIKVFAGTGSNSTRESIEFSRWASQAGVDGVLLVTPYYNKPSQAGLIHHFKSVADAVDCEVMLYNVPGRSVTSLTPATIAELARHPRIRSLKEASGDVAYTSEILDHLEQAGLSMSILSGDDATFMPLMAVGATGVVSVASNLFPRAMVELHDHIMRGNMAGARRIHSKWYPMFRDLFVETNPVPAKAAMKIMGLCSAHVRAPLALLSEKSLSTLTSAMQRCGLEKGTRA
jgi:4-hydroxy-tetrahydrodipicolinate synthase